MRRSSRRRAASVCATCSSAPRSGSRGATPTVPIDAIGSLGESPLDQGEIWEASLDGPVPTQARLSQESDLAWPVAAPEGRAIYALREGRLVAFERGRSAQPVACALQWRKLLGVTPEGEVAGLIADGASTTLALFSPQP